MLCAFSHVVSVNGALEITFMNYELSSDYICSTHLSNSCFRMCTVVVYSTERKCCSTIFEFLALQVAHFQNADADVEACREIVQYRRLTPAYVLPE